MEKAFEVMSFQNSQMIANIFSIINLGNRFNSHFGHFLINWLKKRG